MITSKKKLREDDSYKSSEVDESDEERELTNLNWLLRNQNVTWPKTIDGNSEDDINTNTHVTLPGNQSIATVNANVNCQKKENNSDYASNTNSKSLTKKCITPNLVSYSESRKHSLTANPVAPSKRLSPAERYDIFINKIKRWELKSNTEINLRIISHL